MFNMATTTNLPKENVYRKLEELKDALKWDTFNLTRDQQDGIEIRLVEFKKFLDQEYGRTMGITIEGQG